MKRKVTVTAAEKAAEKIRKDKASAALTLRAEAESERIRATFDAERKALARRYGAAVSLD